MSCGGCNFITEHPFTLLNGRVVCSSCPRATEQRAAMERHVSNMKRMPDRQTRRDYIERLEAAEGAATGEAVRDAFLAQWHTGKQEPQQ
jgi:hypothetical protein